MDNKEAEFQFYTGAKLEGQMPPWTFVIIHEWYDGPLVYAAGTEDGRLFLCFGHDQDKEGGLTDAFAEVSKDNLDAFNDGKLSLRALVSATFKQFGKLLLVRHGIGDEASGSRVTEAKDEAEFWSYHFSGAESAHVEYFHEHGLDKENTARYQCFCEKHIRVSKMPEVSA